MFANIFKIAVQASLLESILVKQQEKSLHSGTSFSCILMFRKVALLEISRSFSLAEVTGLQSLQVATLLKTNS